MYYSRKSPFVLMTMVFICCSQSSVAETDIEKKLDDITVTADSENDKSLSTDLANDIIDAAGHLGDPIQTLYALPGMARIGNTPEAPAVRGSAPEDNLFVVDGMPVGFMFHAYGNSIFDDKLVHDFGLFPGGYAAEYGRATGGVFDISLRDPENKSLETTLDLSLIRAGLFLEGALTANQAFYFSYRESLLQHFLEGTKEDIEKDENIQIESFPVSRDYHGKYVWNLRNGANLSFNLSGASDEFAADVGQYNSNIALYPDREGRSSKDEIFHTQALTYTQYDLELLLGHLLHRQDIQIGPNEYILLDWHEYLLKGQHTVFLSPSHELKYGADLSFGISDYDFNYRFENCDVFTPDCESNTQEITSQKDELSFNQFDAFIQDRWSVNHKLSILAGLRLAYLDYTDEVFLDPRLSLEWYLHPRWTLTAATGIYHQAQEMQKLLPVVGNPELESISANHYLLGLKHALTDYWSINMDIYYKSIDNLALANEEPTEPAYINGATGEAYGAELLIKKSREEKWSGWFALSASKTERTNTLTEKTSPFSYDLPLVMNLIANYSFNTKWTSGIRWTYRSGALYTPILGNRENPEIPGYYLPVYGELNSERSEPYHQLDFHAEYAFFSRYAYGSVYFDILNVYNRINSTGVAYEGRPNSPQYKEVQKGGYTYGVIPSIGLRVTF